MNATPPFGYVLVAEDSDEDFATVLEAATTAGLPHEIRRAATGDDCLRMLDANAREQRPNPRLVLLDLQTPQGDGRNALRRLREDARFRTLPIVVLSTSDNPRDVEFCYVTGANAYHTKPVSYPAHVNTLRAIFDYWLSSVTMPLSAG